METMRRIRRSVAPPPFRCALALALLAGGLAPALAMASQSPDGTQTAVEPGAAASEARCILHLDGGATVRAVARPIDGGASGWEYKNGKSWRAVPAAAIVSVALEKDVLAQLRKLRADRSDDPAMRVELARWMFDQGLLEEALAETDALLTLDREDARTRELVAANAFRFQRPSTDAAVSEIVRSGAQAPPSLREMIVADLQAREDREGLREPLQKALFDGSLRTRSFAALAMRRLFPGQEVRSLLHRAVMDSSEEVRLESALALRVAAEPGLVVPIVRAMESSLVPAVRRNSAEALGNMGYSSAVPALVSRLAAMQGGSGNTVPHSNIFIGRQFAYLQDFDVEVAQFQAVADPQINVLIEGQATDAGVAGVQEIQFASERRVIQGALGKLTRADPGNYARDWLEWWDEHAGAYSQTGATTDVDR